jgi:hypothetical protein
LVIAGVDRDPSAHAPFHRFDAVVDRLSYCLLP